MLAVSHGDHIRTELPKTAMAPTDETVVPAREVHAATN
jgi:hypothetical protein